MHVCPVLIWWWEVFTVRSYCFINIRYKKKRVTHIFSNALNTQASFKGSSVSLSKVVFLLFFPCAQRCVSFPTSSLFFQPAKKNVAKHWWGGLISCLNNSDYLPKSALIDVLKRSSSGSVFSEPHARPTSSSRGKKQELYLWSHLVSPGEFKGEKKKKKSCS